MAHSQWRQVADQLNPRWAKLAALMDRAEADVLALMSFPKDAQGTAARPIRANGSMAGSHGEPRSSASSQRGRRYPSHRLIIILLEQNDNEAVQRAR
jgi:putative transposase